MYWLWTFSAFILARNHITATINTAGVQSAGCLLQCSIKCIQWFTAVRTTGVGSWHCSKARGFVESCQHADNCISQVTQFTCSVFLLILWAGICELTLWTWTIVVHTTTTQSLANPYSVTAVTVFAKVFGLIVVLVNRQLFFTAAALALVCKFKSFILFLCTADTC